MIWKFRFSKFLLKWKVTASVSYFNIAFQISRRKNNIHFHDLKFSIFAIPVGSKSIYVYFMISWIVVIFMR